MSLKRSSLCIVFVLIGCGIFAMAGTLGPAQQQMLDEFLANPAVAAFYEQVKAKFAGTSINALTWAGPQNEGIMKYLPVFTELTGINVNYNTYEFDLVVEKAKMDTIAKAGTYDLIEIPYQHLGWFVINDALIPFKNFMDNNALRSPILAPDDIIKAAWYASSWYNDVCYGFPSVGCSMYLWYRKDLLEDPVEKANFEAKYGYELAPPETWEQFKDIAEFFTRKAGDTLAGETLTHDVYGTALQAKRSDALTCEWLCYAWSFGGGVFKGGIPTLDNLIINSPENVAALEFYKSLLPYAPPGTLEYSYEGPTTAYQQQLVVGVCVEWNDQALTLEDPKKSQVAGKMGYGRIPMAVKLTTQGLPCVSHWGGWSQSVSKYAKHPEAAYLLAQWIISPITQAYLARDGAVIPVRESTFEIPEVASSPPVAATLDALQCSHYRPRIPEWGEMEEKMRIALSRCLLGELSAKEALDWLYDEYVELLR